MNFCSDNTTGIALSVMAPPIGAVYRHRDADVEAFVAAVWRHAGDADQKIVGAQ
ncbi:MAG: hypothetical protein ACE5H8_16000 [Alphaproteobacteria bacterium]